MKYEFNFTQFLTRHLPHHKRQPVRLALFFWPISQIRSLWIEFRIWAKLQVYTANITGQKMSLEHLLNKMVTGSLNQISIASFDDGGLWLSTATENSDSIWLSTEVEATDEAEIPLAGEIATALGADFIVYVPVGANQEQIKQILQTYVVAPFIYVIQTTL